MIRALEKIAASLRDLAAAADESHPIDGDRHNNNLNNLALMTREAHARLHRFEDGLANKQRERDKNGRFI